jgi:methylamine dehydrogenase accessory protein MauD
MTIVLTSQVLLWIAIIIQGGIIMALARQIGVLHERIAPVGALKLDKHTEVGQRAPVFVLDSINARGAVHVGGERPDGKSQLLLFVAPDCPICKVLIPVTTAVARSEKLSVAFIGDGDEAELLQMVTRHSLQNLPFVNNQDIGRKFGVSKLPYAVLIDAAGIVVGSGLVNSREHLESLIEAKELGIASVQEYLTSLNVKKSEAVLEKKHGIHR